MSGTKGGPYLLGVSPKGQYTSLDLLKKGKDLKIPTSTASSILSLAAIQGVDSLNLDAKLVIGFASDAAYLALQQNEAHVMVRSYDSAIKYQGQGQFKPLLQLADKRDELLPDIPTVGEVTTLSDNQKKLLGCLFPEAKIFIAPPGTPKDRVQAWDNAITKVISNPEFQKKIKDQFAAWFGTYSSKEALDELAYLSKNKADFQLYNPLIKKYIQ
jgi:tripartite-type tricarboxylate transporter receptor subunit TctC